MTPTPLRTALLPASVAAMLSPALVACDDDTPASPPPFTYEYTPVATVDIDIPDVDHGSCDACDANAVCTDRSGVTVCVCKAGFTGDGLSCADVDECAAGTCSENASCTNTDGGFTCTCNEGLVGDGITCNDLNECADPETNDCDANALCSNTPGGFTCTCRGGWSGDGKSCTNVNECEGDNDCAPEARCTDTLGSYACSCPGGYTGNGFTCADVDECDAGTDNCNANATCTNTDGGFACECNDGFEGDGVTCDEADGCDPNPCDVNASCTNDSGDAICECNEGYEGTGLSCTEIDGCAVGVNPCDPNADCTSSLGVATCDCRDGFVGDGLTCTPDVPICGLPEALCGLTCVDTSTSEDHCGACDDACCGDEACVGSTCVADGEIRVSLTWDRDGDADLFVTTPSGAMIWRLDDAADGGVVQADSTTFGPENIVWPAGSMPADGTYHVCAYAYSFDPEASLTDPVTATFEVSVGGAILAPLTVVMTSEYANDLDDPVCDPTAPGYAGSFVYPIEL